jgi:hypothetical protein
MELLKTDYREPLTLRPEFIQDGTWCWICEQEYDGDVTIHDSTHWFSTLTKCKTDFLIWAQRKAWNYKLKIEGLDQLLDDLSRKEE